MTPALWVYKCNNKGESHQWSWGDWDEFFDAAGTKPHVWGSTAGIGSAMSQKIIREDLAVGDLVLAWQTDRRVAVGLCRVDDLDEWPDDVGAVQFDLILEPLKRFKVPVPLADMKKFDRKLAAVAALRPGPISTLYPTTPAEAKVLLDRCGLTAPRGGAKEVKRRGGGFGDAASNRIVEARAVAHVTSDLESSGWKVTSVEADRCGYDLLAVKGRLTQHVEVKGVTGTEARFILTAGEHRASSADARWRLALVTNATSARPTLRWFRGAEIAELDVRPISYLVRELA